LGEWNTNSTTRKIARNCQSTWRFCSESNTERVDFGKNLENFEKIFFAQTLQNKDSGEKSAIIFKNFGDSFDIPVDIPTICRCNRHIAIGEYPIKNGLSENWNFSNSPSNNQRELDYYLSLILPSVVNLTSANPNNEGRTLA
jgi:hypothetical protein